MPFTFLQIQWDYYITHAETAIAVDTPVKHYHGERCSSGLDIKMDQIYRRPVPHRDLRVLNQKEDRDLQHKLSMLDKQYRYTLKMLQQRRDTLIREQGRVVMVKVCEPKAIVNIAMKEIGEHKTHVRGVHTSDGRRHYSSKSQHQHEGAELAQKNRSVSAPPASDKPTGPLRHRGNIRASVSLMQMRNIATIDSISEKELARQRQKACEEMDRVRRLQRETLHKRVAEFIISLRDKSDVEILETP
ncbi:hypothetical protein JOB18_037247 [Solea senegalensis]|uniref:Uncharacterized protein n=2 Tax=Solea senegalensis TaxID=28829 RepID=A0AAV6S548_SOLSE|nr:hypothetical protein JOB18_037247 [Solea senegalensis]